LRARTSPSDSNTKQNLFITLPPKNKILNISLKKQAFLRLLQLQFFTSEAGICHSRITE
jgi:hypothetical protein